MTFFNWPRTREVHYLKELKEPEKWYSSSPLLCRWEAETPWPLAQPPRPQQGAGRVVKCIAGHCSIAPLLSARPEPWAAGSPSDLTVSRLCPADPWPQTALCLLLSLPQKHLSLSHPGSAPTLFLCWGHHPQCLGVRS